MLGERGPQPGLFDADTMYRGFVGANTFYGFLAAQRGTLFRDEDFAGLYCRDNGRPSVPPSLLATALVLQTYEGVSDDEAKRRADYDLQWKVALGVALDARPFAKSTLQEFRAQLVIHAEQQAIFRKSLELATRQGYFNGKRKLKVALDTTNILGRGAVKDTYNLLADGIVLVLRVLAKQAGEKLTDWAEQAGFERYVTGGSLKGQTEIDWSDARARRRLLQAIVADADRLLDRVRIARADLDAASLEDMALAEAAGLLARVLAQDIERADDGPDLKRGVAPDRRPSVHDSDMRHGRKSASKRFDGHKADVAVDTDSQLITAVGVLAGNAPDAEQALAMVEATEANTGCAVEATIGDCAYGDGGTRQHFHDAQRTLVAKVPTMTNQGCFPKTDFTLNLEAGTCTCTCPAGETTEDYRPSAAGGGKFHFAVAVCGACPLRAQCVRTGDRGRRVTVHPQERLLQAARALQASPVFREYRTRRQVVEHRIARLIQLGLRQARYVGHPKTLFQVAMAAAVANLTLLMNRPTTEAAAAPLIAVLVGLMSLPVLLRTQWWPFQAPVHLFGGRRGDEQATLLALPPRLPDTSPTRPLRPDF
jgi:transposase